MKRLKSDCNSESIGIFENWTTKNSSNLNISCGAVFFLKWMGSPSSFRKKDHLFLWTTQLSWKTYQVSNLRALMHALITQKWRAGCAMQLNGITLFFTGICFHIVCQSWLHSIWSMLCSVVLMWEQFFQHDTFGDLIHFLNQRTKKINFFTWI